jgi:shikimate dehydrogenase
MTAGTARAADDVHPRRAASFLLVSRARLARAVRAVYLAAVDAGGGSRVALFGVLGHPVSHSLSPSIHAEFYRRHGKDAMYVPVDVAPEALAGFLTDLADCRFQGLNVTYPFKQALAEATPVLDEQARRLDAVNTLVALEGAPVAAGGKPSLPYRGHNTDGEGFCMYLERELAFAAAGKVVVVLGAGSAARAVVLSLLARRPGHVVVLNRGSERLAEPFWKELELQHAPALLRSTTAAASDRNLAELFANADLLVHATPFGLGGLAPADRAPWPLASLTTRTTVVDLKYRKSGPTAFLASLPSGVAAHDGKGMLLYQAAEAFRLWWGHLPDLTGMLERL